MHLYQIDIIQNLMQARFFFSILWLMKMYLTTTI